MPKIQYKEINFRGKSLELINLVNQVINEYKNQGYELTLRQTYYQLVARGYIPNNERSYKNIGNLINDGRLAGLIDWYSIVDRTRNLRGNSHWDKPEDVIASARYSYLLNKWDGQPNYVEVWVEKDALVDIVGQACIPLDTPYFSCRGYTSQSEMWSAAQRFIDQSYRDNCYIMNSPFRKAYNNAIRIARTEGHRIQNEATLDGQHEAKKKGADIVKQWDATLDSRTRPEHREADGQIMELDEPFDVGGEKMQAPGVGGSAKNVCNCRCCLLQRAKWALDDDELKTLQERAAFFGLDKTQSFNDFKQKYLKLPDNADTMNVKEYDVLAHTQKLKGAMSSSDYDEYMKILTEHSNTSLQKLYAKYADQINGVAYGKSGYYSPSGNNLVFSYPLQRHLDGGRSKYSTLAHEYGHYFDKKAEYEGLHFKEIELIHSKTKWLEKMFDKVASSSDEFLAAVRKDRELLKETLTDESKKDLRDHDASAGVQDAIDGLLAERISWGHGDKYYNRKYHSAKQMKDHKGIQAAYKELGIDASNLGKTAFECRVYESASEMWANIMGAEVNGGSELEYVKKYLPNSYEAFIEILKGVK